MIPRSTFRFLCYFVLAGSLVWLCSSSTGQHETMPATMRQMSADADAPHELRQTEAAKNRLAPLAVVALTTGLIAVWLSGAGNAKELPARRRPALKGGADRKEAP